MAILLSLLRSRPQWTIKTFCRSTHPTAKKCFKRKGIVTIENKNIHTRKQFFPFSKLLYFHLYMWLYYQVIICIRRKNLILLQFYIFTNVFEPITIFLTMLEALHTHWLLLALWAIKPPLNENWIDCLTFRLLFSYHNRLTVI